MSSAIFEGYRALGLVTNHVPFIVRYHYKLDDLRIITSSGRSFHSFDSKLRLLETSHEHDSDITCMDSDSEYVYTAAGCHLYAWKHGHRHLQHTYSGHESTIKLILAFGPYIISIDEENSLVVNEIKSGKFVLEMPFSKQVFDISCLMHPATYLNKILLGSKQGTLKLWNHKTLDVVYEFSGWGSGISVIEQSPAVDVVGIGLDNGLILLHNLKFDESLIKFKQEWAPVTAISFRTDGPPLMITASRAGHAVIWDLEKQKLHQQLRSIHSGPIEGAKYLANERLLVTSSSDNSLRVWSFSDYEEEGRLLHEREGHSEPSTCTKFYGPKGNHVLSSGLDSTLRCFSTLSERMNRNFGYASYNRKYAKKVGAKKDPNRMPPIISFSSEETRAKEWDNIVAIHQGLSMVTSWTFEKARMGDHKLVPKKDFPGNVALCSTISSCGNFVVVGYKSGQVDRFNLQSGIHRLSYGSPSKAHEDSVSGVVIDNLNQMVVTGSSDSSIKIWTFKVGNLLTTIDVKSKVTKMVINRENSLIAVAMDSHRVKIIDLETRRVIRFLPTHQAVINDFTFSPDGKWLIVATNDRHLRTWDLPRSKLVDSFLMKKPCRSLDMSPTGELLVTSHYDDLGIYLWSNITLFNPITLKPLDPNVEAKEITFPHVRPDDPLENESFIVGETNVDDQEMKDLSDVYKSPLQINLDMITLSLQPTSRWKNLLNIDLIKKRNKPKDPPKPAAAAPFFLPTVHSLNPFLEVPETSKQVEKNQWLTTARLRGLSKFGELLIDCSSSQDYSPVFSSLKEMGPSMIDVELRSLEIPISVTDVPEDSNENPVLLKYFLQSMSQQLDKKVDFELVQAYLSLFLKIHSETIMKNADLISECKELHDKLIGSWEGLDDMIKRSLCIINYLRSAVI